MVNAIPEGFNTVSVYLVVPNSREAMEHYAAAFGAEVGCVMDAPGGGVLHAELRIGDSTVMLTDANPQWQKKTPEEFGGSPASLHVYVEDVDAAFGRAVEAGCQIAFPVSDMFWGDRYGQVIDKYGHTWGIATHTEDVPEEEMGARAAEWFASMGGEGSG